jgi:hypothetical protein
LGKRDLPVRRQEFVESVFAQFVERIEKNSPWRSRRPIGIWILETLASQGRRRRIAVRLDTQTDPRRQIR